MRSRCSAPSPTPISTDPSLGTDLYSDIDTSGDKMRIDPDDLAVVMEKDPAIVVRR